MGEYEDKLKQHEALLTEGQFVPQRQMTESEKLHAKFFSEEIILVTDMNDLELRAHREELSRIAFEARSRLTAVDKVQRERGAKNKANKGFSASLQTDDITSDAINTINERSKKMSKQDKQIEKMVELGIDRADAEKMFLASTILSIKNKNNPNVTRNGKPEEKKVKKIYTNQCPECSYKHTGMGIVTCPECKTTVEVVIPEDIRGKCPTCMNPFGDVSGVVVCEKCQTKVKVAKKAANPFAKKEEEKKEEVFDISKSEVKQEVFDIPKIEEAVSEIVTEVAKESKSFNPFRK